MKIFTHMKMLAAASLLLSTQASFAGDGTKTSPYTVAELNAQKEMLATSDATVWVKADLKGLGEDGQSTDNADTQDAGNNTVKHMAALFGDATGTFVAYSWHILGQLALSDLTNTKDLLIALTYGSTGHPYGNTASAQYASNEEPADAHFSLEEVHGALTLTINGLRGYHIPACYIVPKDVIAVKVSAGYSASKGAYVNYTNFDGASETPYVTPKNGAVVLMANSGEYDFVLSAALYEQTIYNGNALNPGTQAGVNKGTTTNRARLRFVNDGTKKGFERNSDENCMVTLASKDEVFLQVSSAATNFWGNYAWETSDKNWITWGGGTYAENHTTGINTISATPATTSDAIYNINGQRLSKPQRGLNIINGRKVVIK